MHGGVTLKAAHIDVDKVVDKNRDHTILVLEDKATEL